MLELPCCHRTFHFFVTPNRRAQFDFDQEACMFCLFFVVSASTLYAYRVRYNDTEFTDHELYETRTQKMKFVNHNLGCVTLFPLVFSNVPSFQKFLEMYFACSDETFS